MSTLNLSFATLNVNGLHDNRKCSNIIQWGKIFNFDFMLLQETFLSTSDDYKLFEEKWGGPIFFSPSLSNRSGGVCIAFNSKLPIHITQVKHDGLGRCISVLCTIHNTSFRICNIHAPTLPSERKRFLRELFTFTPGNHPIILAGDFNCVTHKADSSSTSTTTSIFEGRREITDFISINKLVDSFRIFNPTSLGHTWCRQSMNQSSRIDRIYVPKDFRINNVTTSPLPYSDHNPVHAIIQFPHIRRGKGFWKYNVSLNNNKDFCDDLRIHYTLWSTLKTGFNSITDWWENTKTRIKQLAVRHSVRIAREKRKRLLELQSLCTNSSIDEIDNIIRTESNGAFIRSRANILEEGDKPSAFFFRQEKRHAEKKVIRTIRNNSGTIVKNDLDIMNVFHSFYSRLYSDTNNNDINLQDDFINCLNNTVCDSDKSNLEQPISLDDIKSAISAAANNKAPGIDGIPYEFYSCFLDILGNDLVDIYNDIFNRGTLSETQRTSIVTLLPKEGDQCDPTNWRPISLLSTDYKILAKVFQLRLSKIMPTLVNNHQACSVPGRSIHSNMLIIRDIIDYSAIRNNSCAIISLDQYKAFDTVNWSFLLKVLEKLNFGDYFRKWISILYQDIYSRIIINGNISEAIPLHRGVRQGCPLSPSLYVLFIEPIARFINNCDHIRGFSIPGGNGRTVKFLQYADDATCIATSPTDLKRFFDVFTLFQSATGASLNIGKTRGLKIGEFETNQFPTSIRWSTTSIRITGVVFGSKDAVHTNWTKKTDTAVGLLNSWKHRFLTLLGKIIVINTVIYPLFYFIAPVYPIPDKVLKEVNKAVFSLIWGDNKPDLVARKVLNMEKKEGGLGLHSFKNKMDALFIKPLLPVLLDDTPVHLILTRYFIATHLRREFPHIWSNSRPNSDICHPSLLYACEIIKKLNGIDNNFTIACTRTKDLTKMLQPSDISIAAVRHQPALPWAIIWRRTFDKVLDNKLTGFQWRLAHDVLYTGKRINDWGMGTGICPFARCNVIETTSHIFWDCPKIQDILSWVEKTFTSLSGNIATFNINLFLYGFPDYNIPHNVFIRMWFIFCITKFVIWKSRCLHVFESQVQTSTVLRSIIIREIKLRVEADRSRFYLSKFTNIWTDGSSFVKLDNGKLHFNL